MRYCLILTTLLPTLEQNMKCVPHPPCSPNIALLDFFCLFAPRNVIKQIASLPSQLITKSFTHIRTNRILVPLRQYLKPELTLWLCLVHCSISTSAFAFSVHFASVSAKPRCTAVSALFNFISPTLNLSFNLEPSVILRAIIKLLER